MNTIFLTTFVFINRYLSFVEKYPTPVAHFAVRPHLFKIMYKEVMYYTDLRSKMTKLNNEELSKIPQIIRKRRVEEKSAEKIKSTHCWYIRHRARRKEMKIKEALKLAKLKAEREAAGEDEDEDQFNIFSSSDEESETDD